MNDSSICCLFQQCYFPCGKRCTCAQQGTDFAAEFTCKAFEAALFPNILKCCPHINVKWPTLGKRNSTSRYNQQHSL